jgi:hypothetical protein
MITLRRRSLRAGHKIIVLQLLHITNLLLSYYYNITSPLLFHYYNITTLSLLQPLTTFHYRTSPYFAGCLNRPASGCMVPAPSLARALVSARFKLATLGSGGHGKESALPLASQPACLLARRSLHQ